MAEILELESKPVIIGIGVFVLLSLIGTVYLIQGDAYMCNDNNQTIVGLCFKLSAINSAGLQTRCYYNESTPTYYKNCKTGWIKYDNKSVIGDETNMTTYIEYTKYSLRTDFIKKIDAEDYIINLKKEVKSNVTILRTEQYPFSNEKRVYWSVIMYTEVMREDESSIIITRKVLNEETLYTVFPEDYNLTQINETINNNAEEYLTRWSPSIII